MAGIAASESLNYLSKKEAGRKKEPIRKRLRSLRLGPFGKKRQEAKELLIKEMS